MKILQIKIFIFLVSLISLSICSSNKCPQISCQQNQLCLNSKCVNIDQINLDQLKSTIYNLISTQHHRQALQILQKLLKKYKQSSQLYYYAALASFALQQNKDSLRYIKHALQIDKTISEYYLIRGRAFTQQLKFKQAQNQYLKALSLNFDDKGLISFYLAQMYLKNDKYQESIKKYQQALNYHPDKVFWYLRKAIAHSINHEYKMALITCKQGLKKDPNNQQIRLFMKQFENIDQKYQQKVQQAQEKNQQRSKNVDVDPEIIKEIIKEKYEEKVLDFDRKRIEEKQRNKRLKEIKQMQL